jgi:hypothetical protein
VVTRPIPDSPAKSRLHTSSAPWPNGVMRPIPVTTTRREEVFKGAVLKGRPPLSGEKPNAAV